MKKLLVVTVLVFCLGGCEGGWHPLDCAMGNSYSPDWCPPGTRGYENQMNGQGKSYADAMRAIAAAAAVGASAENNTLVNSPPIGVPSNQALIDHIDGAFSGWQGDTIYKLADGRVIQQSAPYFYYYYAFNPEVVVYRAEGSGYSIHVIGAGGQDVPIRFLQ